MHAAVDLGASSGRLVAGQIVGGRLRTEEVARFSNQPVRFPDGLHWNVPSLYQEVLDGLGSLGRSAGGAPVSVGIDAWAVDYGLLDDEGRLLGLPYHYRDARTAGLVEEAARRFGGRERIYQATGVQVLPINTVYQLMADRPTPAYAAATQLLMIPDLFAFLLTGERRLETTNASTTQLVDVRTGAFVDELFSLLELRKDIFAPRVDPGAVIGDLLPAISRDLGLERSPLVVAVPSHDTAAAVAAVPARTANFAFVVAGTWALVGVERETPIVDAASMASNFSNEVGLGGSIRFLKNVMGFWMLQQCQATWRSRQLNDSLSVLVERAAREKPFRSLVDTAAPQFVPPGDMPARIQSACAAAGEPPPVEQSAVVRCVLDSMALAIAEALDALERCTGQSIDVVHVVGGGAGNGHFLELVAAASGRPIVAGPVEASVAGNLLVQLQAGRSLADADELREVVSRSFDLRSVAPDAQLARHAAAARARFQALTGSCATR